MLDFLNYSGLAVLASLVSECCTTSLMMNYVAALVRFPWSSSARCVRYVLVGDVLPQACETNSMTEEA